MKDYLKESQPEEIEQLKKLKSERNPTGRNRKNRLNRNFYSDISKRKDQVLNVCRDSQEPWEPHDYL